MFLVLKHSENLWADISVAGALGLLGFIITLGAYLLYELRHNSFKARFKSYNNSVSSFSKNCYASTRVSVIHHRLTELFLNKYRISDYRRESFTIEGIKSILSDIGKIRLEALMAFASARGIIKNNNSPITSIDNIKEKISEAKELKRLLLRSNELLFLLLRIKNYYNKICSEIKETIGDYEHYSFFSSDDYVTIIKSMKSGDMYFLLKDKGLISVVRGMKKESLPFNMKSDSYIFLASEAKKRYVIDYMSMGQDSATLFALLMGKEDKNIQKINENRLNNKTNLNK